MYKYNNMNNNNTLRARLLAEGRVSKNPTLFYLVSDFQNPAWIRLEGVQKPTSAGKSLRKSGKPPRSPRSPGKPPRSPRSLGKPPRSPRSPGKPPRSPRSPGKSPRPPGKPPESLINKAIREGNELIARLSDKEKPKKTPGRLFNNKGIYIPP